MLSKLKMDQYASGLENQNINFLNLDLDYFLHFTTKIRRIKFLMFKEEHIILPTVSYRSKLNQ